MVMVSASAVVAVRFRGGGLGYPNPNHSSVHACGVGGGHLWSLWTLVLGVRGVVPCRQHGGYGHGVCLGGGCCVRLLDGWVHRAEFLF